MVSVRMPADRAPVGETAKGRWLEVRRYSPDEAMRHIAGLAAWYRTGQRPQGKLFEEGGAIERREMRTEGNFVKAAIGFSDVLGAIDALGKGTLEYWVALGVWRDGGRVTDVARRLERRDAMVWAAFYSATEAMLYTLTREPGMKHYFQIWREARHQRRLQDGV